jgi:O-antigen ligase
MPSSIALLAYFLLVVLFLHWSKDPKDSPALWLPVIWLFIVSSRLPSVWFGVSSATSAVAATEEGNSLDRTVYLALLATALYVLARRKVHWSEFFARNLTLTSYLAFALISVIWSDYSFISFKRYVRDLNPYVMAFVVLSDPRPTRAISTVIRRVCYILLTLSLLLIKYFPAVGIVFNQWDGRPEYVGVGTGKNMLGKICMVSVLFFFWDTLGRWPERKSRTGRLILVTNITSILMALRLFMLFDSATSQGCLILGFMIVLLARSKLVKANPRLLTAGILVAITGYLLLASVFDLSEMFAGLMGRDPTLTGRTDIWKVLLQMQTNPLIGLGYASLWAGDRMAAILRIAGSNFVNETHNGYLEIYMTLGFVGLALCVVFLLAGFRKICRQISVFPHYAAFALALWVIVVIYNRTESAMSGELLWSVLLYFTIAVPRTEQGLSEVALFTPRMGTALQPRILTRPSATSERTPGI